MNMNFSSPKIFILLQFLLLVSLVYHVFSLETSFHQLSNQTFQQKEKFHKLRKKIADRLQQINKPAVKTIYSPHGDIIDCVLFQNQPAFDHPLLKGHKPSDPPEIPRWYNKTDILNDNFQLWSLSGESCPKGTIPIIRITEQHILRAGSLDRFGKKSIDHVNSELTREFVTAQHLNGVYYGGQATLNLWNPHVENPNEFSSAQMWLIAGSGNDINSIEVGWIVYPDVFGDNYSRLFIHWTADSYKKTGCLNLQCPGFIQTNPKIVLGAPFNPISTYNGDQYEIPFLVWKDQRTGHWWLAAGPGNLIGYWPYSLFTKLKNNAERVDFGGEILNGHSNGHSSTQMGSGHFAREGFGKAAYIRNMNLVDENNTLKTANNPQFFVQYPNCYDHNTQSVKEDNFFYFGGPGKNIKCQ